MRRDLAITNKNRCHKSLLVGVDRRSCDSCCCELNCWGIVIATCHVSLRIIAPKGGCFDQGLFSKISSRGFHFLVVPRNTGVVKKKWDWCQDFITRFPWFWGLEHEARTTPSYTVSFQHSDKIAIAD